MIDWLHQVWASKLSEKQNQLLFFGKMNNRSSIESIVDYKIELYKIKQLHEVPIIVHLIPHKTQPWTDNTVQLAYP